MGWWQIVLGVVVGLCALMVLVIIHELGHAWAAKRNGVKVEEFGIGFPPRAKILGKYKGTLITLNWLLPLGGFCKMKGDDDFASAKEDELEDRKRKSRDKDSFEAAGFWAKTKILFAGVFMNLIAACVIMTILAWVGMPKILDDQFTMPSDTITELSPVVVVNVVKGSPAEKFESEYGDCERTKDNGEIEKIGCFPNGIQLNDELISIAGEKIERPSDVSKLTEKYRGREVEIVYRGKRQRAKDCGLSECSFMFTLTSKIKLNEKNEGKGFLGVSTGQSEKFRATWSAPIVGVVNTFQFIWATIAGIGQMIANLSVGLWGLIVQNPDAGAQMSAVGDSVAGPIGILGVIFPAALASGATEFLFLVGVISLTLTVMNILPIPGLDGGRWYLIAGFKLFKKKLTKKTEETVVGIGMLVLFGLVILITISDVMKLW